MQTVPQKRDHLLAVDLLRGVAILMVVVYHFLGHRLQLTWTDGHRNLAVSGTSEALLYPFTFCWAGVALFFVISGFCIHLSFLRSAHFTWSRFYWHRFWRIIPAYYVALLAFFALACVNNPWEARPADLLTHLFLIHNFFDDTFFGINPAFWSIAVEVQLYLLFPLLIFVRGRHTIEWCLGCTLAVGILWRAAVALTWAKSSQLMPENLICAEFTCPLVTWFDWSLGALIAERVHEGRAAFRQRALWLVLLIPALMGSTLYQPLTIFSFSLAALISAIALDGILQINIRKTGALGALGFIGVISYSIYLWHQPLIFFLSGHQREHGSVWVFVIIRAAVILLVSYLSYIWIEQSGIMLGSRLWKKKPSVLPKLEPISPTVPKPD